MIHDFVTILAIDVNQNITSILEIASDKWRRCHILKSDNLNGRIFKLNLWYIPENEVSEREEVHNKSSSSPPSRCYVYSHLPSPIMMIPICIVVDTEYSHFIFQHQTSSIQIVQSTTYGSSTFHERHVAALFLQCFIEKITRKTKNVCCKSRSLVFVVRKCVTFESADFAREKCISCIHATELIDSGNTIAHLEW